MGSRADQHHVRHAILAVAPDAARHFAAAPGVPEFIAFLAGPHARFVTEPLPT